MTSEQLRRKRLHVTVGGVCNNRCRFCIESNLEWRRKEAALFTPERTRETLERNRGVGSVLFTAGEPTLNPDLPLFIGMAREMGYENIGIVSNGRRLADRNLCKALVEAGLNHITISVHGSDAETHDALTTRQGSFDETWQGILNFSEIKTQLPWMHFALSIVLNRVNIPRIDDMMRRFLSVNVSTVTFLPMRVQGFALDNLDELFVPLAEAAHVFRDAVRGISDSVDVSRLCLSGIPPCLMTGVETNWNLLETVVLTSGESDDTTLWTFDENHEKHDDCIRCVYQKLCPGIAREYIERSGWDEYVPVERIPENVREYLHKMAESKNAGNVTGTAERCAMESELADARERFASSESIKNSEKAELAWRIGWLYLKLDDHDDAIAWLEIATGLEPRFAGAHLTHAKALLRKGDIESAKRALRTADKLQLSTEDRAEIRTMMSRLDVTYKLK